MSESQYEFNEAQNLVIWELSKKMKFVSIFLIVIGVLQVIPGILLVFMSVFSASVVVEIIGRSLIYIFIGVWGASAANSFRQVVDTKGNDIDHMMSALGDLKTAATLTYWLLIIFIILLIAVTMAFVFFGFMIAGSAIANPG